MPQPASPSALGCQPPRAFGICSHHASRKMGAWTADSNQQEFGILELCPPKRTSSFPVFTFAAMAAQVLVLGSASYGRLQTGPAVLGSRKSFWPTFAGLERKVTDLGLALSQPRHLSPEPAQPHPPWRHPGPRTPGLQHSVLIGGLSHWLLRTPGPRV